LLKRQIRRYLDGVDLTVEPWRGFIAVIDRSYHEADDDRALVESAMELSSQELLQANAELRGLVQAFPDLVLHVDVDGAIAAQRGSAARAFGTSRGALVGQHLRDLFSASEVEAFEARLAQTRATGEVTTVTHSRSERGVAIVHEMRLATLGGGAVIAIVRDVTEARRSEELRLAVEGAEAASVAKSAFLANMSHELRTPLNAILGYSELLAEDAAPETRQDLDRIQGAGRRLLHIINAMLDIARIEAGRVEVELGTVELDGFVADAIAAVQADAADKGLTLTSSVAPGLTKVRTDRAKLKQVIENLLGNAIKFTERGQVELVVRAGPAGQPPGLVLAVRDSGIGISPEKMGRLFQDFAQADESSTRRFGGAGLGLAISRRLCTLLGGRVEVESTYGIGSTFSVWIPDPAARLDSDGHNRPAPAAPVVERVA
jgi:PAS domain S-box-containing protein